jgi:hypothetical protein
LLSVWWILPPREEQFAAFAAVLLCRAIDGNLTDCPGRARFLLITF